MIDRCEAEVLELHRFFEAWLGGALEDSPESFDRLSDVLSERFQRLGPQGRRQERRQVLADLRRAHGLYRQQSPPFRIRIERLEGRFRAGGLCVVTYDEWQRLGTGVRGRASTAVFRERDGTPQGVEWLHLQETWLPDDAPAPEI